MATCCPNLAGAQINADSGQFPPMKTIPPSIFRRSRPIGLAILFGLILGACSSTQRTRSYQAEAFTPETPFQYYSSREPDGACEIGKRALLSQGYQIEGAQSRTIRGEKFFQPTPEQATKLTITLVCLPSSLGAVIYANALETNFELKSRGSSAGVSVSGFGSLSLPWAADKDTLVKVGEVTITSPEFYQRLFELIKTLDG
jgi:hypothetical protein